MIQEPEREAFDLRLDACGADLARWPEGHAERAAGLLARDAEARRRHAEARRLDALVAEAARADTPRGFAFRVVAGVAARRENRWLFGSASRAGLASATFCAAALAIGLGLGASVGAGGATAAGLDLGAAVELSLSDGDL